MDGSGATATPYEADVILWSREQAAALRAGDLSRLDLEHLADEIEDVGKSEQRELASHMANLLATCCSTTTSRSVAVEAGLSPSPPSAMKPSETFERRRAFAHY